MNRRESLQAGLGIATAMLPGVHIGYAQEPKSYRVGLIGCGWYGKSDLFRLIQVAPVEVVSLCDPDKRMLENAAKMVSERQKSKKVPQTFGDYREMLKNKGLDIVLVGTPDHWHALTAIAAMEAGADVYLQKPISVDVLEGEAILSTARKLKRVVQVGMQRRSTPHLLDAKKNIIEAGKLGKIGHIDICCYFHMRANGNPALQKVPEWFDYDMWTGPAPLRPYDGIPHRRWWRTFMEYGNGIVGDMCVHMLDMVRWLVGLGWPKKITSSGGILVQKEGKSNISDTQSAIFEFDNYNVVWQHRTWGTPPDPAYQWAAFIYGDKGTLKLSTMSYDFIPQRGGKAIHKDCVFEKEQFPEDIKEPDIEMNAAPATRGQMKDFLKAIEDRSKPVADIEQGHISAASCILANLSAELGRSLVYDHAKREVVGDAEATKKLKRKYREPWKHPGETLE